MTLWTSQDAAEATGGRATRDFAVGGVSIDTRTIRPGDLFVALQAARDGHDFVARALEKGACAALVSRIPEGVAPDAPLLVVPDVLPALEALGRAGRARMRGKVVAITGSVGKTSTKEMARVALAGQGRVHAAEASYNNHWGVPLTLARMPEDTDFAIVEIGMNHPGEIEPLARLARPHVAMVTTVAAAHLEAFGAIEGIAREKGAIFRGLIQPGTAIIPEDLPVTQLLRDCADDAAAIVIGFGQQGMARPLKAETLDGVTRVRARVLGETVDFMLASAGTHFVMNAVGMLAALSAAGADVAEAAKHLSDWRPPLGRGAVEDLDGIRLIDDAYAGSPAMPAWSAISSGPSSSMSPRIATRRPPVSRASVARPAESARRPAHARPARGAAARPARNACRDGRRTGRESRRTGRVRRYRAREGFEVLQGLDGG